MSSHRLCVLPWRLALGALALVVLASSGLAATQYSDKVVQKGAEAKEIPGEITDESIDGIKIGGVEINLRAVARVEYSDAPAAYKEAEELRKSGRYSEAADKYQAALNNPVARKFWLIPACKFGAAICQVEEGTDTAAAEAGFKDLLKEYPKTRYRYDALMGWGRALTANKKYDEAVAKFNELTTDALRGREDEWALRAGLGKSQAYLDGSMFDKAKDEAKKTADSCGTKFTDIRVQCQVVQATVDSRKGDYDKAIDMLRGSIHDIAGLVATEMEKTPGDTRLRKTEAICFNTLGQAYFKKAVKGKNPDDYREALLGFLWNVVLYGNQFPNEHALALDYAAKCFKELKQDNRASDLATELKKSYPDYK